jgi:alpha-mannosidase
MTPRALILLSPYRFPAQNPLMLGNEDIAAFLNGYSALWHPAALAGSGSPPRVSSPYDHEKPSAGHVYGVPASPPLVLPDDWEERVCAAGAVTFRATADRSETLDNLRQALERLEGPQGGVRFDRSARDAGPFYGVGLGLVILEALCEAMERENSLSRGDFWLDIQAAVAALAGPDPEAARHHLQAAADRLLAAREVLYPVNIHLLDLCLLEPAAKGQPLPAAFELRTPLNLIAPTAVLEELGRTAPDRQAALRERLHAELLDVAGGPYREREDALLPLESQLWNLQKGLRLGRELLDQEIRVFARRRFAAHPQLPQLLNCVGLRRAVLLAFDSSVIPSHRATMINWPSPDGRQIEAFTRAPYAAESPQTYFHWAHYLHKTIAQDHTATLGLLHAQSPAGPWYADLLELSRLSPVFGQWTTLSRYFNDTLAGEYVSAAGADEFHGDYLTERTEAHRSDPVSGFARHLRLRRRLDTGWTLAALTRGLLGRQDPQRYEPDLAAVEDQIEEEQAGVSEALQSVEREAAQVLADRLLSRATGNEAGYLILNPCSFARRVALELAGCAHPLELAGPLKAFQLQGETGLAVVEVPGLGFAWLPRHGRASTPPPPARLRLADARHVRNEYFEAEIDPNTGGLKALRDHRFRTNRIGQQLVFNPGSVMRAREVKLVSTGPALGEVVSEGGIYDEHDNLLALYRQRFRAWLGRPILDLRIELFSEHPPQGYPWHAYYGARFAWRDEQATLLRGINGTGYVTTHTRPESPDYLELRSARQSTVLFPGGLPFHQRHGGRMLDVILVPEGETGKVFELALGLDRDYPMQTALGMVTPVAVVPVAKGPPHVGTAGWLFHLDSPNLLLTRLWPDAQGLDAIHARLLECHQQGCQAELRCVRNPQRARLLDCQGATQLEGTVSGDGVQFEVSSGELVNLRIEFE